MIKKYFPRWKGGRPHFFLRLSMLHLKSHIGPLTKKEKKGAYNFRLTLGLEFQFRGHGANSV